MKQATLNFKMKHGVDQASRDGILYRICVIRFADGWGKAAVAEHRNYIVEVSTTGELPVTFSTYGHKAFTYENAREFCQQIADGEIDLDELQARYDAEDAEKERAAIREAVTQAKALRDVLAKRGMGYADFLALESAHRRMGTLGQQILNGYARGEGWPDV